MPTPFGIRRRIKALLGIESAPAAARTETPKVQLTVVGPDGAEQTTTCDVGNTLLSAAGRLKRPIASGCSEASCGTCRVEILEGGDCLTEQAPRERATLKENGFASTMRLACRAELASAGALKVKAFELM